MTKKQILILAIVAVSALALVGILAEDPEYAADVARRLAEATRRAAP